MSLTHINANGDAQMVDVSLKQVTQRTATAEAYVRFPPQVYAAIQLNNGITKKGSIVEVAKIAGIMAAKKTWDVIPMCHPLMLEACDIEAQYLDDQTSIYLNATVRVTHKTGVEMEALTAVSVAALTIYDMCKALSHDIEIDNIRLIHKAGGKRDVTK